MVQSSAEEAALVFVLTVTVVVPRPVGYYCNHDDEDPLASTN